VSFAKARKGDLLDMLVILIGLDEIVSFVSYVVFAMTSLVFLSLSSEITTTIVFYDS